MHTLVGVMAKFNAPDFKWVFDWFIFCLTRKIASLEIEVLNDACLLNYSLFKWH